MNRYSEISPSAYSPMTFEEIAMVPLMKRKQHDDVLAKQELIRSGLAKVDPLKEHLEEALRLKQGIESQMDNTALELSKNGINNDMIGKTIALNREYNDLIAPTGEIGIINAATKAMELEKEKFYKNADKQFGQDRLDKAWEQHRAEYAKNLGRDKDGNIVNIGSLGSPKYVDLDTGIRDVLSTLGHTTREKLLNSGLSFKNTKYGPVMVNSQGSVVTNTNDEQLNNALNALKTRFIDKTGEGRISRDFEGRTTDEDLNYINNRVLGAKIFEQNKDYKTNYDSISTGDGNGDGKNGGATPLISIQNEIQSKEFANQKYSDNLKEYKRLSSIPIDKRTEEDNVKLELIKNLQKDVDEKLKQTNVYKQNQPKVQSFDSKIDPLYRDFIQNADNMSASEYDKEIENITKKELAKIKTTKGFVSGREGIVSINVRKKVNDLLNQRREIYKPITEAKDKLTALNNRQFYHYALAPITEKEQGQYQNLNNILATAVKSSPSALSNLGLIESVDLANGSKKYKLTEEQRNQIQTLLYNSDRKNIRLESVSEKGPGGKPQLRIAFTPNEDADVDLAGVNWFGKNSDNLNDKEIYLNLAVNNLTNKKAGGPDIKNIVGLIVNYIGERGETTENGTTEGYDIAKSFINNAYGVND